MRSNDRPDPGREPGHPGSGLVRIGGALVALPAVLLAATWQASGSFDEAVAVASWPAFLMWPIGALLVVAGLAGRLMHRTIGSIRNHPTRREVDLRDGRSHDLPD